MCADDPRPDLLTTAWAVLALMDMRYVDDDFDDGGLMADACRGLDRLASALPIGDPLADASVALARSNLWHMESASAWPEDDPARVRAFNLLRLIENPDAWPADPFVAVLVINAVKRAEPTGWLHAVWTADLHGRIMEPVCIGEPTAGRTGSVDPAATLAVQVGRSGVTALHVLARQSCPGCCYGCFGRYSGRANSPIPIGPCGPIY